MMERWHMGATKSISVARQIFWLKVSLSPSTDKTHRALPFRGKGKVNANSQKSMKLLMSFAEN